MAGGVVSGKLHAYAVSVTAFSSDDRDQFEARIAAALEAEGIDYVNESVLAELTPEQPS